MIFGDQKLKTKLHVEKSLFFRFFIFFDRFGMVFAWYDLKSIINYSKLKLHTKSIPTMMKKMKNQKNKDFSTSSLVFTFCSPNIIVNELKL